MTPGRQLGFIWGTMALLAVVVSPWAHRLATGLPTCLFKGVAGVPCPTCGTTRSALSLADFDIVAALTVSPLATLAWIAVIGGGLVAGGLAMIGREPPQPPATLSDLQRWSVLGLLLANWAYLIVTGA
ncbi:MAG: DUF2752 domain-containing protein [Acidobacteriota bacterium]